MRRLMIYRYSTKDGSDLFIFILLHYLNSVLYVASEKFEYLMEIMMHCKVPEQVVTKLKVVLK